MEVRRSNNLLEEVSLSSEYGIKGLDEFKVSIKKIRLKVGMVCSKENPTWSLLGSDACNCV